MVTVIRDSWAGQVRESRGVKEKKKRVSLFEPKRPRTLRTCLSIVPWSLLFVFYLFFFFLSLFPYFFRKYGVRSNCFSFFYSASLLYILLESTTLPLIYSINKHSCQDLDFSAWHSRYSPALLQSIHSQVSTLAPYFPLGARSLIQLVSCRFFFKAHCLERFIGANAEPLSHAPWISGDFGKCSRMRA